MRAYKFRIYPTAGQCAQLERDFNACRFTWNWALRQRLDNYEKVVLPKKKEGTYNPKEDNINWIDLSAKLTKIKKEEEFNFLKDASAACLVRVLRNLEEAYKKFFRGEARLPKFKNHFRNNSSTYQMRKIYRLQDGERIILPNPKVFDDGRLLVLPKIGPMRVKWSDSVEGFPNSATVSKRNGKYYVSLQCSIDVVRKGKETEECVGLNFGVSTVLTTSDGKKFHGRSFMKKNLRRVKFIQRRLSRKQKGSQRWERNKLRLGSKHEQIANQRNDFLHKISKFICENYNEIAIEAMPIKQMMKSPIKKTNQKKKKGKKKVLKNRLAKKIADCGWYELIRKITYKSQWYGRHLWIVDNLLEKRYTCHDCGYINEGLQWWKHRWECPACHVMQESQFNAAMNVWKAAELKYGEERRNLCAGTGHQSINAD